jgi:hypothetical protein
MRQIGFSVRRSRFALKPRSPLSEDDRIRRGKSEERESIVPVTSEGNHKRTDL